MTFFLLFLSPEDESAKDFPRMILDFLKHMTGSKNNIKGSSLDIDWNLSKAILRTKDLYTREDILLNG
jgi:hypothetical protein